MALHIFCLIMPKYIRFGRIIFTDVILDLYGNVFRGPTEAIRKPLLGKICLAEFNGAMEKLYEELSSQ